MKNIAFLICCTGILSIFLDKSFAEGSPVLSGNTPAGQRDAAVLSDGEYMLTVNDYKELKEKGGLLVQYPARQKKLWEGVTFYFENRTGRKVDAVLESADGHSGTGEAVHLVRISPSFPLKRERNGISDGNCVPMSFSTGKWRFPILGRSIRSRTTMTPRSNWFTACWQMLWFQGTAVR